MIETLLQDVRYATRMLLKNPVFTAVTVMTLALGIGVNTTIFTFINTLLLRPPSGVEDSHRLMAVWNRLPNGGYMQQCYPDYVYYRDHNRVFSGLLCYSSDPIRVSWRAAGQTEIIYAHLVSGNYFSVLGVKPGLGRAFLPEEDQIPGRNPVVVLQHAFWQQRLGSDPNIAGKTLILNGHAFNVVGVAPQGFTGIETGMVPDLWAPVMMQPLIIPGEEMLSTQSSYWIFAVGRLKSDITVSQAQADFSVLAGQLAATHPKSNKGWDAAVLPAIGVPPEFRGLVVPFTALLMLMVGLVLLIACANAANLLLSRAVGRGREMAIRSALGANRGRLVRQVLAESVLLAFLAGAVSLLLVLWTAPLLLNLKPAMLSFITLDLSLDWRIAGFTLLISLLTGFIFGLGPALHGSAGDVVMKLKDSSFGGYHKSRLRSFLVVAQVAVCLILLISAGLCLRSLFNAHSIDPGFQINNRLTVSFDLQILGYSKARGERFYQELLDRTAGLPGVVSSSLAHYLPLGFTRRSAEVVVEGHQPPPPQRGFPVGTTAVGPGYFKTMGIPLLRGREFGPRDSVDSPKVVIINDAMARRFWPGQDPIGRRVSFGFDNPRALEIIGVVKTGKYRSLRDDAAPFMYESFSQSYRPRATLVVHTAADPKQSLPAVRSAIRELDPNLPVLQAETLEEYMAVPLFGARVTGILLSGFGGLALLLALVGLYSAVAYSVSQRTREFGIRMAVGAGPVDLIRLVIHEGLPLILIGLVIGVACALGTTQVLSSLLYGIGPTDPLTFIGVSLLLVGVAVAASYIPARRATKVDPMVALRYE
ncbi:MAG TPA: ABC transporter permease [Acidobacteriota bacterium]